MSVKIGYSLDKKTKTTYAFVKAAPEYPDGIDWYLIMRLDALNLMKERDYRLTHERLKGFTSKAVCNSEDEFDEETGRQVARDKLLRKYYIFCRGALDEYYEALGNVERAAYATNEAIYGRLQDVYTRLDKVEDGIK